MASNGTTAGVRPTVITANWKMHKLRAEAMEYASELGAWLDDHAAAESQASLQVIVAPPYTSLELLVESNPPFAVFAQNMHQADSGAFTGEVSPAMLRDIGAHGVILGHSERRLYFGETDEALAEKVAAAVEFGLHPMLCVGESLEQRRGGEAEAVVSRQLEIALRDLEIDVSSGTSLYVAYEPVWAIGTGETASAETAQQMHLLIRNSLAEMFDPAVAACLPVLYGGSVKPANAGELLGMTDIDGALVGGAALEVPSFTGIIEAAVARSATAGVQ